MRLQCPNCDAEYEVDASAIPFEGRDVQCSNCGHGWFQVHPDFEADQDIEAALYDPPPPLPQDSRASAARSLDPRAAFVAANPLGMKAQAIPQPELPKREIDPQALRILREEVAYEAAKRATEGSARPAMSARAAAMPLDGTAAARPPRDGFSIEDELDKVISAAPTQGAPFQGAQFQGAPFQGAPFQEAPSQEAALQAPPAQDMRASVVVARRVARLKGGDGGRSDSAATFSAAGQTIAAQAVQPMPTASARLPAAQDQFAPADMPRKRGKKLGFYTGILAALAASASYILAPEIAANLPQIAAPLGQYVGAINTLRDGLDGLIGTVTGGILPQIGQIGADLVQRAMAFMTQLGWF